MGNEFIALMERPLIANGAEISRICGFVKIEKNLTKSTGASVKYHYFCRAASNEAEVVYKHSEKTRASHTNGPRDVPRCGALS